MRKQPIRFLMLFLLGIILISGCSGIFPSAQSVPESDVSAEQPEKQAAPTDEVVEEIPASKEATSAPTSTSEPSPEELQEEPTETIAPTSTQVEIRQGLVASDPTTAELASGQIQLVEFFAFW